MTRSMNELRMIKGKKFSQCFWVQEGLRIENSISLMFRCFWNQIRFSSKTVFLLAISPILWMSTWFYRFLVRIFFFFFHVENINLNEYNNNLTLRHLLTWFTWKFSHHSFSKSFSHIFLVLFSLRDLPLFNSERNFFG